MKKLTFVCGTIALLFIVGAGCSNNSQTNSKPAGDVQNQNQQVTTATPEDTGLVLNGEAKGNQNVNLQWQVSDNLKKDAEGYGITWGKDQNPEYPGHFWYQRGSTHFDLSWNGFPVGQAHFRVCILKNQKCTVYSNDLQLEVK